MTDLLINGFVTLFVILDPLGLVPLFLTVTTGAGEAQRRRIALRACLIAFGILALFGLFGLRLLDGLGISLGAFRVAGGLFLFWIGFELVFEKRQERHERSTTRVMEEVDLSHVAAFPLAIPLMAGPGAISAVILLSGSLPTVVGQLGLLAVIALALGLTFACLRLANRLDRFLGATGRVVVSRLLGVLLAALAVQFVADGIGELYATISRDRALG
ncbi:MarC family protein [Aurantimonas sp. Leaf443]|uniref:MarC family protein n=1 Tax=Aurantimonas sp. Leaf443 TaxID=1736378 RepID=UPI0006FBFA80|nr:MarC family protein [Aurantimonas sp. Leaf443]KQT83507.1 MarC family transcriptional regulator [Aurantimonas sp. Leaf443]